ncbi:hypothetical protein BHE74_00033943 [Ensete ventricosum]|nr:hypothetical protein BHE74_00033943 [Ensete ventricosum]RZS20947.1 hypothetical protein BHM03_00053528 [Ensete ventricosum]
MQDLGSSGPGLLAITEVPEAPDLRWLILPFARKLALLGRKDRARVLKVITISMPLDSGLSYWSSWVGIPYQGKTWGSISKLLQ